MGAQMGPHNEQLLVPRRQAAGKNHVSGLFREPNRPGREYAFPANGRFAGRPPAHAWAALCHCGHCPCCSRVPSYLNLSLPSQPSSEAASSWNPPESARSARSYCLSTSHLVFAGPCRPRCLTNARPNTRVGSPVQRWPYMTTTESGPSSSLAMLTWASPITFVMPQFPHWEEGEAARPGVCVAAHRCAVTPARASPPPSGLG